MANQMFEQFKKLLTKWLTERGVEVEEIRLFDIRGHQYTHGHSSERYAFLGDERLFFLGDIKALEPLREQLSDYISAFFAFYDRMSGDQVFKALVQPHNPVFLPVGKGFRINSASDLSVIQGPLEPTNVIKWLAFKALEHASGRPVDITIDYARSEADCDRFFYFDEITPEQSEDIRAVLARAKTKDEVAQPRAMFGEPDPYKNTHGPLTGHVGIDWREESERYRREHEDCVSLTKLREVVNRADCNVDCEAHCGLAEAVYELVKPSVQTVHNHVFEKVEINGALVGLGVEFSALERGYAMTFKHLVGPAERIAGFLERYGDARTAAEIVLVVGKDWYIARRCLLTQIGIQMQAADTVIVENLHFRVSEPLCRTISASKPSATAATKPSSSTTSPLGPTPFRPEHD